MLSRRSWRPLDQTRIAVGEEAVAGGHRMRIGGLDLLGEVTGIGDYAEVLAVSEPVELFDRTFKVLTLDALISYVHASREAFAAEMRRFRESNLIINCLIDLRHYRFGTQQRPAIRPKP